MRVLFFLGFRDANRVFDLVGSFNVLNVPFHGNYVVLTGKSNDIEDIIMRNRDAKITSCMMSYTDRSPVS
jgi:hypothetical protein